MRLGNFGRMALLTTCFTFCTALFGQRAENLLTNADVIKMVKGGVPESAIVASIRSGPGAFDLSNGAKAALFAAGGKNRVSEMTEIWEAMIAKATNGRGGDDADEMNPQPYPPRGKTTTPGSVGQSGVDPAITQKLPPGAKVHLLTEDEFQKLVAKSPGAPPKGTESSAVKNPNASPQGSSVLTALAKQRQAADADVLQIKAVRASGLMQTMSSTAPMGQASMANSAPQRVEGKPAASGTSQYARMPAPMVNGCYAISKGQVTIGNVTGQSHTVTFTPISQYNLYTIHGCNFGDANPGAKVWIYGLGFHADFAIEEWMDDSIVVKLGENISGVADQDNLHLVVHRADGKEAQADGFKFYAARERVLLQYIPPAWRKIDHNVTGSQHWGWHPSTQDNSPVSGPNVPSQAAGVTTIYVSRRLAEKFAPASDSFDFSQLPQGWAVDSATWINFPANCPNVVTYRENFGQWNLQWNATAIQFAWSDTSCSGFWPNPLLGIPTSAYQNHTESNYALTVWVTGPRGRESDLPHM